MDFYGLQVLKLAQQDLVTLMMELTGQHLLLVQVFLLHLLHQLPGMVTN